MNLHQFAALKAGDKIEALNGSIGTVMEIKDRGIMLSWDKAPHASFYYSVNSTVWMHWTVKQTDLEAEAGALKASLHHDVGGHSL